MTMILLAGIILNLCLFCFLIAQMNRVKRSVHAVKVMYFADVSDVTGVIKSKKKVQVKAQLFIGDVPVGHSFVMSEQITEVVDEKKISDLIENIAKPLANLGVRVMTKSFNG